MLSDSLRPNTFDEVFGNEATISGLKKMVSQPPGKRTHVYLFTGPSGTGKTTLARIVAAELGAANDFNFIDKNAALSRGIDEIREIQKHARFSPMGGGPRVIIFDEAHGLTDEAQNGLLKLLEDIPEYQYYMLLTTKPEGLLETVRSRATLCPTEPLDEETLSLLLKSATKKASLTPVDDAVIERIIENSNGSARAALVYLENVSGLPPDTALYLLKTPDNIPPETTEIPLEDVQALAAAELSDMPKEVVRQARALLRDPNLIDWICGDFVRMGIAGEQELALGAYLAGTSRLLDKPLGIIVQGATASGKSHVLNKIASLFPPKDAVLRAHTITPAALSHMKVGSLVHRFVVAGERRHAQGQAAADITRELRELFSDGEYRKLMATAHGTKEIYQPGPIAYAETTTLSDSLITDEDRNRFVVLRSDETEEQTQRVQRHQAELAAGEYPSGQRQKETIELHHAIQRLLRIRQVKIRFAKKIQRQFPTDSIEARRAHDQLLTVIKASALLHQYQRTRTEDGSIWANRDDWSVANTIFGPALARQLGQSPSPAALTVLKAAVPKVFTAKDIEGKCPYGESTVAKALKELIQLGAVEIVEPHRGRRAATYRFLRTHDEIANRRLEISLPTYAEIEARVNALHRERSRRRRAQ